MMKEHYSQRDHERRTSKTRLRRYISEPIRADLWTELQLLILTFSTGIQDAVSFPDFLCFASNQTGNTVVLAVGLTGYRGDFVNLANVGVSLSLFLAGAILTGQIGNHIGSRRRWWQCVSNLLQTTMTLGAAWLQFSRGTQQSGPWALAVIALLAFSSGAQVAAARAFKMPEISTAMATAAWVDLLIDPGLLVLKNRPRDRRAFFLVALALGSLAGAFMRARIGSPLALVVSAVGKAVVIPMLLVARTDRDDSCNVAVRVDHKV